MANSNSSLDSSIHPKFSSLSADAPFHPSELYRSTVAVESHEAELKITTRRQSEGGTGGTEMCALRALRGFCLSFFFQSEGEYTGSDGWKVEVIEDGR